MNDDTRNLIDHLGAELAGTMEDASAVAALLRGVPQDDLGRVIGMLESASDKSHAFVAALRSLLPEADCPTKGADRLRERAD